MYDAYKYRNHFHQSCNNAMHRSHPTRNCQCTVVTPTDKFPGNFANHPLSQWNTLGNTDARYSLHHHSILGQCGKQHHKLHHYNLRMYSRSRTRKWILVGIVSVLKLSISSSFPQTFQRCVSCLERCLRVQSWWLCRSCKGRNHSLPRFLIVHSRESTRLGRVPR